MDINLPDRSGIDLCKEVKKNILLFLLLVSALLTSKVLYKR